jgi:hypothetical protein
MAITAQAQENADAPLEEIVVQGYRNSLKASLTTAGGQGANRFAGGEPFGCVVAQDEAAKFRAAFNE